MNYSKTAVLLALASIASPCVAAGGPNFIDGMSVAGIWHLPVILTLCALVFAAASNRFANAIGALVTCVLICVFISIFGGIVGLIVAAVVGPWVTFIVVAAIACASSPTNSKKDTHAQCQITKSQSK